MSPTWVVRIQTAVTTAVTFLLVGLAHWLATKNISVDPTPAVAVIVPIIMGFVAVAYRVVVRWLQDHVNPAFGWLKGHPGIVTAVLNPTAAVEALPVGPHQAPPPAA